MQWLRDSTWLYPAVETLHILGFAILTGAAFVFDLRLLGLSPSIPIADLEQHVLPWARRSFFVLVIPTGALLLASQPELLTSRVFQLKLLLIAIACMNALLFHRGVSTPRIAGALSLTLWIAVIVCGRLLAYV